jgi:hypothetical protein
LLIALSGEDLDVRTAWTSDDIIDDRDTIAAEAATPG